MEISLKNDDKGETRKRRKTEWYCARHKKGFTRPADYRRHMDSTKDHGDERVECFHPQCFRTFSRQDNARQHASKKHTDISLPPTKRKGRPPKFVKAQRPPDIAAESNSTVQNPTATQEDLEVQHMLAPYTPAQQLNPDFNWNPGLVVPDHIATENPIVPDTQTSNVPFSYPAKQNSIAPVQASTRLNPHSSQPMNAAYRSSSPPKVSSTQAETSNVIAPSPQALEDWDFTRPLHLPTLPKAHHRRSRTHRSSVYDQGQYLDLQSVVRHTPRSEPAYHHDTTDTLCEDSRHLFSSTVSEHDSEDIIAAIDRTARYYLGAGNPLQQGTATQHRKQICILHPLDESLYHAIERVTRRRSNSTSMVEIRNKAKQRLHFLQELQLELSQSSDTSHTSHFNAIPQFWNANKSHAPKGLDAALVKETEFVNPATPANVRPQYSTSTQPREDILKSVGSWSGSDEQMIPDANEISNIHPSDLRGFMCDEGVSYQQFTATIAPEAPDSTYYDTTCSYDYRGAGEGIPRWPWQSGSAHGGNVS